MAFGVRDLWVVAEPGAEPDLAQLGEHHQLESREDAGRLTVLKYRVAPAPLWHAGGTLLQAAVSLRDQKTSGELLRCDLPAPRRVGFLCPGRPGFLRTTFEWMDVAGHQSGGERLIWMHPPGAGSEKVVTWPKVAVGSTLGLVAGFTELGSRRARAPVRVSVWVGNRKLLEQRFSREHRLVPIRIDVPASHQGKQPVSIVVSTRRSDRNDFGIDLGGLP